MSSNLYFEAIEAAEQLRNTAEEKIHKRLIESMSPQIKAMIESKLTSESDKQKKDDEEKTDEYGEELSEYDEEASECGMQYNAADESIQEVALDEDSRRILSKFISEKSKKDSLKEKMKNISESILAIRNAIILVENTKSTSSEKKKISLLFKNIVKEVKNIKSSVIIKKDISLQKDYYKIMKELNNMSTRQNRKSFLNESLEDLLEMNLFEDEGEEQEQEQDQKDQEDLDLDSLDLELPDAEEKDSDEDASSFKVGPDSTVEDLAREAGLLDKDMADEDDDESEDVDEFNFEGLFESDLDDSEMESYLESDLEDGENCGPDEMAESYGRDRVLEIDENMLRREIGKMKSIREGEAKDMASHFGGGSVEGEVFVDGVELNKLHEMKIKAAKVVRKNRMLESRLSQYKKALRGMKGQLAEMNLFNAKLLYANKLMQNKNLTIKQQRNIVESLDDAKTLGEAKILFESLSKSLVSNRGASQKRSLSEGAVRRRSGSASASVRSGQTLNESVALDRWATLAGIRN